MKTAVSPADYTLTIDLPGDMLNPQAKKPKPQPSVGAETYQSRANDAVENFNGILAEMQRELQDAKKQNAEMSHKIKSAEEAKRASEDEVLAATEKERKKFVELQLEIARRDIEEMKNKESYERLVVAAKGVVGSNAREFGDRVAELEGALNGL